MFNKISAWLIRKGIWFVFILFGIVLFTQLQPSYKQAGEYSSATESYEDASKAMSRLAEKTQKQIEKAKEKPVKYLDDKINEAKEEIQTINKEINALTGPKSLLPKNLVRKQELKFDLKVTEWKQDQYERIRDLRLKDPTFSTTAYQVGSPPSSEGYINEMRSVLNKEKAALQDDWVYEHITQPVEQYWSSALFALVLALLFAPLSRVVCFYLLAPLATKQTPIQISTLAGSPDGSVQSSESNAGIKLNLKPSQVLLAHHDYTKAIPQNCSTSSQLLLDLESPLTSILAGLYNLVRVQTADATTVELSAGHDGLHELICIEIEKGDGIVVEPRNIVGIVVELGQKVTLEKHWALNKWQSWLKWQFRYITVSGPATVILKGGRGVVISAVDGSFMIPSDYVVAFSSNLGYTTSRTETFSGYYTRKKGLLNDRFIGDKGIVIHQEANYESSTHGKKSGLEGVVDGLLKAFGI